MQKENRFIHFLYYCIKTNFLYEYRQYGAAGKCNMMTTQLQNPSFAPKRSVSFYGNISLRPRESLLVSYNYLGGVF